MNRYDKANIAYKIDGYLFPGGSFEDAKKELRNVILREIDLVDELTEEMYLHSKKNWFRS